MLPTHTRELGRRRDDVFAPVLGLAPGPVLGSGRLLVPGRDLDPPPRLILSAIPLLSTAVLPRNHVRGERRRLDRRVRGEYGVLQTTTSTGEASCRIAVWRSGRRDFPTDQTRDDQLGLIRHAARV